MTNNTFKCITVQCQTMDIDLFNQLCDKLSSTRRWCMDYRIVADFNNYHEKPYWHSNSYRENDTMLIDTVKNSVKKDVHTFCRLHNLSTDCTTVTILTIEREAITRD